MAVAALLMVSPSAGAAPRSVSWGEVVARHRAHVVYPREERGSEAAMCQVSVTIDDSGTPETVEVTRCSAGLAPAVRAAAMASRCRPYEVDGIPVPVSFRYAIYLPARRALRAPEQRASGTGTIRGQVVDRLGHPAPGRVLVTGDDTWIHVDTDADGHFELTGLPPGTYAEQAFSSDGEPSRETRMLEVQAARISVSDLVYDDSPAPEVILDGGAGPVVDYLSRAATGPLATSAAGPPCTRIPTLRPPVEGPTVPMRTSDDACLTLNGTWYPAADYGSLQLGAAAHSLPGVTPSSFAGTAPDAVTLIIDGVTVDRPAPAPFGD